MAISSVLELAPLPDRQPRIGRVWLTEFGVKAIVRLKMDPVPLPQGVEKREITISWRSPSTRGKEVQEVREIGWSGLQQFISEDDCLRMVLARNQEEVTQAAAIAVMALVIHELECEEVVEVLPTGSGGDYHLSRVRWGKPVQIEVSGLREDPTGKRSKRRLKEKCVQVLKESRAGFASVTTFSFGRRKQIHSYLHYVVRGKR
jgi:hypothetical protein